MVIMWMVWINVLLFISTGVVVSLEGLWGLFCQLQCKGYHPVVWWLICPCWVCWPIVGPFALVWLLLCCCRVIACMSWTSKRLRLFSEKVAKLKTGFVLVVEGAVIVLVFAHFALSMLCKLLWLPLFGDQAC